MKYDRALAFRWRYMLGCAILFAIIAILSGMDGVVELIRKGEMAECGYSLKFVTEVLQKQSIQMLLPIFATIPFSVSFVEERKSNMVRNILVRTKKRDYLTSKAITVACAGGTLLVLMVLMFGLLSFVLFRGVEAPMEDVSYVQEMLHTFGVITIRYFLIGALWAEIGLVVSTWLNHRLMAYISPMLVYYLLVILCERYFTWCHIAYPSDWLNLEVSWPLKQWSLCLWLLFLIIVTVILFFRTGWQILTKM